MGPGSDEAHEPREDRRFTGLRAEPQAVGAVPDGPPPAIAGSLQRDDSSRQQTRQ